MFLKLNQIMKLLTNYVSILWKEKVIVMKMMKISFPFLKILTGKDWCFTQFSTGMAGWLLLIFFYMFTQSVKFYTFNYQYKCLKNVIHQINSRMNGCSFQQVLGRNLG